MDSQNKITDEGAKHIAELIRVNNKLNVLFMRWNQIKAKGASYLCKSIQGNEVLQILDVSFNSFGSQVINFPLNNSVNGNPTLP